MFHLHSRSHTGCQWARLKVIYKTYNKSENRLPKAVIPKHFDTADQLGGNGVFGGAGHLSRAYVKALHSLTWARRHSRACANGQGCSCSMHAHSCTYTKGQGVLTWSAHMCKGTVWVGMRGECVVAGRSVTAAQSSQDHGLAPDCRPRVRDP